MLNDLVLVLVPSHAILITYASMDNEFVDAELGFQACRSYSVGTMQLVIREQETI